MDRLSFKRHRLPADFISHAIWLYARFAPRYRDVDKMPAARRLDIPYRSVRRRLLKFGSTAAATYTTFYYQRHRIKRPRFKHLPSASFDARQAASVAT